MPERSNLSNQIRELTLALASAHVKSQEIFQSEVQKTEAQFRETDQRIAEMRRETQEQFRETDKRFAEMIAVLDERIDKLVIAMGEFIRRNSNGRGKQ